MVVRRPHRVARVIAGVVMLAGCSGDASSEVGQSPSPAEEISVSASSPAASQSASPAPAAPAWAPPDMSGEDVETAVALIESKLRRRGLDPVTDLADGTIKVEGKTLGLANVVATLAGQPQDRWPTTVDGHLDTVLRIAKDEGPASFRAAAGDLRILLYASSYLKQAGGGALGKPAAPGLLAVPVRDDGEAVQLITSGQAQDWGVSADEIFARASQNTFSRRVPRPVRQGGIGLVGPGFYSTSWLLSLEDVIGGPAPDGALVVVPRRDEMVFAVVGERTDERVVQALAEGAAASYAEGPNAISDDVYWWREGEIATLRTTQRGGRVRVTVPPSLARLLQD